MWTSTPPAAGRGRAPLTIAATEGFVADAYRDEVIAYYSEIGPDYALWSSQHHMHFGYYRVGMNPMRLEPMLQQMSREVFERLMPCPRAQLLDAGCGVGSVARQCVRTYADSHVVGVNIVPGAIAEARRLGKFAACDSAIHYVCCDYLALPFADDLFDGVYAIESACHAPRHRIGRLVQGFYRVLKPGRRIVFADGFLRTPDRMPAWLGRIYREFCNGWALDSLPVLPWFTQELEAAGFTDIRVEDASWRILPSALFIPLAAGRMLAARLAKPHRRLSRRQCAHLAAPFAVPLFATFPGRFGYFLITATKPA